MPNRIARHVCTETHSLYPGGAKNGLPAAKQLESDGQCDVPDIHWALLHYVTRITYSVMHVGQLCYACFTRSTHAQNWFSPNNRAQAFQDRLTYSKQTLVYIETTIL